MGIFSQYIDKKLSIKNFIMEESRTTGVILLLKSQLCDGPFVVKTFDEEEITLNLDEEITV